MFTQYVPEHERAYLAALINAALEGGNLISVNDGEEWVITRASTLESIAPVLGAAEEDFLKVYDQGGERLGSFWLIYNNGSEDDPEIVVADCSDNDFCQRVLDQASQEAGA